MGGQIQGLLGFQAARQEGSAQKAAAFYNAQVASQNANLQEQVTKADITRQRQENYVRQGQSVAASGGLTGSSLDTILGNAIQEEFDILNTQFQSNINRTNLLNGAQLSIYQGKTAKKTSRLQGAASILAGTAQDAKTAASFMGGGAA